MFPSVAVALELIRMIRTEPRRKPRMEIIKLSMRVSVHKISPFWRIGGKTRFEEQIHPKV